MTKLEESRIDIVESKVDGLVDSVKEIRDALIGNDYTSGYGLIQNYIDLHKRMKLLERIVWAGGGVFFTFSILYAVVSLIK